MSIKTTPVVSGQQAAALTRVAETTAAEQAARQTRIEAIRAARATGLTLAAVGVAAGCTMQNVHILTRPPRP